ncbi:MAG: glycosyltransferase family 2 protein [Oscillatoriales cyanobacterium RM2_1_1]|nr:glycosyltransferase family 2 protein [Oscillatoriales cyanobacterium RM2_1_1]
MDVLQAQSLHSTELPTVDGQRPALSLVVPIYNEVESLPKLIQEIKEAMAELGQDYELICIDDGSKDGSADWLRREAQVNPRLRAIILRRNYGQTAAMAAGFDYALGDIIVTLDGDLQNPPSEIHKVVGKLNEGYDLVSGWRKDRQDPVSRKLPSKIANWLIGQMTDVRLHDYGCSLKAYRREVVADMRLYGELHRFLPALAAIEGALISEIPVLHKERQYGSSKYGIDRTFRVVMDLMTIAFMKRFLTRPMHVFGLLGMVSLLVGLFLGGYLTFLKYGMGEQIGDRPLLVLAVLLTLTGIQLFCFGLLAEVSMRTYHESQNRPIYRVREVASSSRS